MNLYLKWKSFARFYRIVIYIFLAVALFLATLPLMLEKGAEYALVKQGAKFAEIENIDLNLFTGRLKVENMQIVMADKPSLTLQQFFVDLNWLALFKKRIHIEKLTLDNTDFAVVFEPEKSIKIAGFDIPLNSTEKKVEEEDDFDWGFGISQLQLTNIAVNIVIPKFNKTIQVKELSLNKLLTWQVNEKATLAVKVIVQSGVLQGRFNLQPFTKKQIFKGKLELSGWQFQDYKTLFPQEINDLSGNLNATINLAIHLQQEQINVSQSGKVLLKNISLTQQDLAIGIKNLEWNGQLDFDNKIQKTINLTGNVLINKAKVNNESAKILIAKFASLQSDVNFQFPQKIKLKNISLSKLLVGKKPSKVKPILGLQSLKLAKIDFLTADKISLGKLNLSGLNASILLDEQQALTELNAFLEALPMSKKESKAVEKEPIFNFSLAELQLDDSHIFIENLATQPVFKKNIKINKLTVSEVDNIKLQQKIKLFLDAKMDEFTTVKLTGDIEPFNPKTNADLSLAIEQLDLYSFSSLIRDALGYRIQSGMMDATVDFKVKDNILNSKNNLKLVGFELEPEVKKLKEQTTEQTTDDTELVNNEVVELNSIGLALNMLRDSNGDIDLDVPIKGDLFSPEFKIKKVVNTALINALKGGTKLVLFTALQPYSSIYLAGKLAYDKASALSLQPIEFKAGTTSMKKDMHIYLAKIAKLLTEKKGVTIKVCGFYSVKDKQALSKKEVTEKVLKNQLYKLAEKRQTNVKNWLVKKGKVASKRLVTCSPEFKDQPVTGVNLLM